eukprot:552702-Alexandrium_andersonii.AAC.1
MERRRLLRGCWPTSVQGGEAPRCPLCGWGEASSQHLLVWCPAVVAAWRSLAGPAAPPLLRV